MTVCEAQDGQPIRPGHAYIAPGEPAPAGECGRRQVRLPAATMARRSTGTSPRVDVLFRSVAPVPAAERHRRAC